MRWARCANRVAGSGRRTYGGVATSPIGIGSWRGAPTCVITNLTNRTGHVELATQRPLFSGSRTGLLVFRSPEDELFQPLAMMPPRPAAGDLAARHGPDRAAHPDGRIDVNDPHADHRDRGQRVHEHRDAILLDRRVVRKILVPDRHAARDQYDDHERHRP